MSPSGDTDIEQWLTSRLREMKAFPAEGTAEALRLTVGRAKGQDFAAGGRPWGGLGALPFK